MTPPMHKENKMQKRNRLGMARSKTTRVDGGSGLNKFCSRKTSPLLFAAQITNICMGRIQGSSTSSMKHTNNYNYKTSDETK